MSEKKDERTLDSKELAALKDRLEQARDGLDPPAGTELTGQENDEPAAPAETEQPEQENDEPAAPTYTELSEQVRCDIAAAARYCNTNVPKEKEVYDLAAALAAESAWQYFRGEAGKYTGAYKTVMEDLYRDIHLLFSETLPAYDPGVTVTDHMLNVLRKRLTQALIHTRIPAITGRIWRSGRKTALNGSETCRNPGTVPISAGKASYSGRETGGASGKQFPGIR